MLCVFSVLLWKLLLLKHCCGSCSCESKLEREREREEKKEGLCDCKIVGEFAFRGRTHLKRREIETSVVAKLWKNLAKRSVVVAKLFGELLAFCRLHAFVCVCVCVCVCERERERERRGCCKVLEELFSFPSLRTV